MAALVAGHLDQSSVFGVELRLKREGSAHGGGEGVMASTASSEIADSDLSVD